MTGNRSPTTRQRRPEPALAALLFAGLGSVLCGRLPAQSVRPVIQVQFEMEGDLFASLPADEQSSIAQQVAEKVCAQAARRWGYLDWSPQGPDTTQVAEWIVRLEVESKQLTLEDGDIVELSIVRLNHYAGRGDEQFLLHQSEHARVLYDWGDPKPQQTADVLRDDLMRKLDEQLDPLLQDWTVETALLKIPVGDKLIADTDNQRIVVPLRLREDLRAEDESIFKVRLVIPDSMQAAFKLRESGEVLEPGELQGYIVGKVVDWDVRSLSPTIPTWWIDELPALLADAEGVEVFLFEYNPSLSGSSETVDGVVLDPEPEEVQP